MKSGAACPSRFLYSRYQIYKDDGFSGTNFKRPGFLDMIGDIEAGLVLSLIHISMIESEPHGQGAVVPRYKK